MQLYHTWNVTAAAVDIIFKELANIYTYNYVNEFSYLPLYPAYFWECMCDFQYDEYIESLWRK